MELDYLSRIGIDQSTGACLLGLSHSHREQRADVLAVAPLVVKYLADLFEV